MNTILGLDISVTCTGWAVVELESGSLLAYGNFKPPRKAEFYERCEYLVERVQRIRLDYNPCDVWVEAMIVHPRHGAGMANLHRVWGAVVQKALLKEPGTVYPSEMKMLATGHGNATKTDMVNAAEMRWGVQFETDDEADACWAAEAGRLRFNAVLSL